MATSDASKELWQAVFDPASVALIGASDNPAKTSSRPLRYLTQAGWKGRVYPVNPFRDTVLGAQAWRDVSLLPEVPDHVYILTDSDAAIEAVRSCAQLGVPVVSLIATGFSESDSAGAQRAAEIRSILADSRTRVLGPGTLGVSTPRTGFRLTGNAAFADDAVTPGGVFVASQSGSMIGALLSRGSAMGVGFSGLVSTGNELDISLGELCELTLSDPHVTSYALFLENLRGAERLKRFAREAAKLCRPVLVYKLGRSQVGAALAVGHTGALAGDDAVASALFREYGMGRVMNLDTLLEAQHLARRIPVTGTSELRTVVMTTTGGGGAMVVDQLGLRGCQLTSPSDRVAAKLAELVADVTVGPLIDLTLAGAAYETVTKALQIVSESGEFDLILVAAGSSARTHPELVIQPVIDAADSKTPVAVFVVPHATNAHQMVQRAGVSSFGTPEACADAVLAIVDRKQPRPDHLDASVGSPVAPHTAVLDEVAGYTLLARLGLPVAEHTVVLDDLTVLDVPAPYVVKGLSSDLPHKSDAGAVVLGVHDREGILDAIDSIRGAVGEHAPNATIAGFLVQHMVSGAVGEVIIGYRVDPDVGPVIVVGSGGVTAELHDDAAVTLAPVTPDEAAAMVTSVASLRPIAGYRGSTPGDLAALAAAISAFSTLAFQPHVIEAEVNPLLVLADGKGVRAVDALVQVDPEKRVADV